MQTTTFIYNNISYIFHYYDSDPSGLGCITEIVERNEYQLDQFISFEQKSLLDIGANCGVATIILAKQNPLSTVYSFEPDKNVFELLKANIAANQLQNVILHNCAVSKKNIETLELCIHPCYSGGNSTYSNKDQFDTIFTSNITTYIVPVISLDKIINKYSLTEIELLKIDCEGGEYDILYDSDYVKNKYIKNIVGEFHNLRYNTSITHTADELLIYCNEHIAGLKKISILTW
jgi:FkbM family methyltransferase